MPAERMIPFTMSEPRYDQTTYWGRFQTIIEASSPRYAFKSNDEVMRNYKLVKEQRQRESVALEKTGKPHVLLPQKEIDALRHAINITKAAVHPDTEEPIPIPMRITFYVPGNFPITMGMIFCRPTIFNTLFWQVMNQTYVAALNYSYSNKSSPSSNYDLLKSYVSAVSACCVTSAFIRYKTQPVIARATGARLIMLNTVTSMLACAVGGWVNNFSIRSPEVQRGIAIVDPNSGQTVGISQECARNARLQTANSRIMMALPMALPAVALAGI